MTDIERLNARAHEIAEAERLARRAGELGKDDAVALSGAGIALAFVVGDLDSGAAFTDRAAPVSRGVCPLMAPRHWRRRRQSPSRS